MIDWTNGLAFRVEGAQYSEGDDAIPERVIVCAECFDSAEGPMGLEEEDVFEDAESLAEEDEPDECFSCHKTITEDSARAWDVMHARSRAAGVEEGRRQERERIGKKHQASNARLGSAASEGKSSKVLRD